VQHAGDALLHPLVLVTTMLQWQHETVRPAIPPLPIHTPSPAAVPYPPRPTPTPPHPPTHTTQVCGVEAVRPVRKGEALSMDYGPDKLDNTLLLDYGVLDTASAKVRP